MAKTSELLIKAKKELNEARRLDGFFVLSFYVELCEAITKATEATEEEVATARRLRRRIREVIAPHKWAHSWFCHKLKVSEVITKDVRDEWGHANAQKIYEWRQAWLDELIKEYQAKGD